MTETQKQAKALRAKNRKAAQHGDGYIRYACWYLEHDENGQSLGDVERWSVVYKYPGDKLETAFIKKLEARIAEARAIGHSFWEYDDGESYQHQTMYCSSEGE